MFSTRGRDSPQRCRTFTARLKVVGLINADREQHDAYVSLAANAGLNEGAMDTLEYGFKHPQKVKRRFLPEGTAQYEAVTRLTAPTAPRRRDPHPRPIYDEDTIRDIDRPAGKSYMQLATMAFEGGGFGKLHAP